MFSTDRAVRENLLLFASHYVDQVLGDSRDFEVLFAGKKEELIESLQQALLFIIEAIEDENLPVESVTSFAQSYAEHFIIYFHDAETLIRDCSKLRTQLRSQIADTYFPNEKNDRATHMINLFVDEFMIRLFREKHWEIERMEVEKFNAIGNMASGMAHELRNPITSIKGFLKLIYEKHPHPSEIQHYYTIIEDEVKRLDYILERFLSLTKRKNLRMKREFEEVDLGGLLEHSLALFEFEFLRLGIETSIDIEPGLLIRGNSKEIEQTFINIIKNACEEFQQIPGQKEKLLKLACKATAKDISVIFFNNGTPIDMKSLKEIFNPFFTTKENGTGLGLAICKQIIEAHGGKISISPQSDGTIVEVRLPKYLEGSM
jgi:signal transduction histidine kinase